MKLKLNREYAMRHLFVTLLLVALGGYFGYDGLVGYPSKPAADLYEEIEHSKPPETLTTADLEAFKQMKVRRQFEFCGLCLVGALVIGLRLLKSARFRFEFDDDGFVFGGRRFAYSEIKQVDRSAWEKKGIVVVNGIKLDAWHHQGVREFVEKLDAV